MDDQTEACDECMQTGEHCCGEGDDVPGFSAADFGPFVDAS